MEIRLYEGSGKALNGVVDNNWSCAALIPCLNEAATIGALVREAERFVQAVWVVDDGSSDKTRQQAEAAGAIVVRHEINLGKGAALRDGLNALAAAGYQWAVTLDGDGQHDPSTIPAFFRAAESGGDLVIGNRMPDAAQMPAIRRFVNRWMSAKISKRLKMKIPDSQCGFRLVRLAAWKNLSIHENQFAFESEMLVVFAEAKYKIAFVPIRSLNARRPSRIHTVADTYRWFRWWLRS
jgi:glycosyltransferase involved in cell wall biosynthesis